MIRTTAMMALAALALTPASAQDEAAKQQQVLVVVAHPDDELFMAPAIAALARQGAKVTLAFATRGEAGPGVSGMEPGERLGETRMQEGFCSGGELGLSEMYSFVLPDGEVGVHRFMDHAEDAWPLMHSVLPLMRGVDLVLTWGPDGGYGHADHRMTSAIMTQMVQGMPTATRPRLLYVAIPAGTRPDIREMYDWAETDPALVTESIAYTPADLEAATAAAQCHVTQFDEASRAGMMALFDATMWRGKVHFRPAF
jgi:LmbE family N-acetylglucosaminyl deacetylase